MAIPGYKILRKIGDGGMSSVYLAIQLSVGREVALKVLSPELRQNSAYRDKFFREANIVGTLSHPNIISIYDVGSEGEHCYIAMDYLPGACCSEQIKAGQISIPTALRIAKDIAAALNYTHKNGYVHADVKSDNILFRGDGSAILTDYGIAVSTKITNTNSGKMGIAGTPNYMSPEQSQGNPIDGRSDIYSLGVVLYEMLTGSLPYKAKDAVGVAVQHLSADIPKLPANLSMLQPVINKMLAKKPSSRYQSGQDVIQAITTIEGSFNIGGNPTLNTTSSLHTRSLLSALFATLFSQLTHKFHRPSTALAHPNAMAFAGSGTDNGTIEEWSYSNGSTQRLRQTNVDTKTFNTQTLQVLNHGNAKNTPKYLMIAFLLALLAGGGIWLLTYYKNRFPLISTSDVAKPEIVADSKTSDIAGPNGDQEHAAQSRVAGVDARPTLSSNTTANDTQAAEASVRREGKVQQPSLPMPKKTYSLSIKAVPANATIRVLNIKPKYREGMQLESGKYHISASSDGYETLRKWITITDQPYQTTLKLKKSTPVYTAGDIIEKPLPSGYKAPIMIVIPKGSFLMGDVSGAGFSNANPVHQVTLRKSFAMSVNEITIAQYKVYAEAENLPLPDQVADQDVQQPIAAITWQEAVDYANWLSRQTGAQYRLPSETEWEYAARARSETLYWWGEQNNDKNANCRRGCKSDWSKLFSASSAPVASFASNAFGLNDTAGNIAEWTLDCYAGDYRDIPTDGTAYQSKKCEQRVVRGGSFLSGSDDIASAARSSSAAASRSHTIGFRLLMELK